MAEQLTRLQKKVNGQWVTQFPVTMAEGVITNGVDGEAARTLDEELTGIEARFQADDARMDGIDEEIEILDGELKTKTTINDTASAYPFQKTGVVSAVVPAAKGSTMRVMASANGTLLHGSESIQVTAGMAVLIIAVGGGDSLSVSAGTMDIAYNRDSMDMVRQYLPLVTAKGPIATLPGLIDGLPLNPILSVLAALTGTGEISPDNRYELNGVTGANLRQYSPNAANPAEMIDSGLNGTTGNEDTVKTRLRTGFLPSVFDGKTGAISGVPAGMISKGTYCYDANKTFLGTGAANAVKGGYVRFVYANSDDTTNITPETLTAFRASFQYEPGATTAGLYQPFVAFNAHNIQFGREVIGFAHAPAEVRLDGKPSKSTGRKVTFNGTEAWSLSGVTGVDGVKIFIRPISGAKNYGASVIGAGILCDAYKAVQPSSIGSLAVNQCFIRTTSDDARTDAYFAAPYDTVDEFKAALAAAPITVFYELETPDEFTLGPATIPDIVSLAGTNHLYSDAGDVEASGYMTAGAAYDAQQDEIDELRAALELLLPQGG